MSIMLCVGMSYQYVASSIENPLPTTIGRKVKITAKHFPDLQQKFPDVAIDPELKILCTVASPNTRHAMKVTNIDSTGRRRSPDIWVTINGPAELVAQKKRVRFAHDVVDNTGKNRLGISRRAVTIPDVDGDDQEVRALSRDQQASSAERDNLQDFRFDSPDGASELVSGAGISMQQLFAPLRPVVRVLSPEVKPVIGRSLVDALDRLPDDQLRALISKAVIFPEPSKIDFATLQKIESGDPTTAMIFKNTIKLANVVASQIIDRFMDVTCDAPGTLIQYQVWLQTKLIVQIQEILRAQQDGVLAHFEREKKNELEHLKISIKDIKRTAKNIAEQHQAALMAYGAVSIVAAGVPVVLKGSIDQALSTGEKRMFYGLFGAMTVWSLYQTVQTMVLRNHDRVKNESVLHAEQQELQSVEKMPYKPEGVIAAFDEDMVRFLRNTRAKIARFIEVEAQRLSRDLQQHTAQCEQRVRTVSYQRLPQEDMGTTLDASTQVESSDLSWFGNRLMQGAKTVMESV